jgi:hypothetical protein
MGELMVKIVIASMFIFVFSLCTAPFSEAYTTLNFEGTITSITDTNNILLGDNPIGTAFHGTLLYDSSLVNKGHMMNMDLIGLVYAGKYVFDTPNDQAFIQTYFPNMTQFGILPYNPITASTQNGNILYATGASAVRFDQNGKGTWFIGNIDQSFNINGSVNSVTTTPIPPAFLLMGSGIVGLFGMRKKLQQQVA